VEHDITTATTGAEHDRTDVAATAHDTTDVAAVERDSTTATTEGSATPAAAPEGHAPQPVSYVSVPPNVWALARADIARYRRDSLGGKGWDKRKDTLMRAKARAPSRGTPTRMRRRCTEHLPLRRGAVPRPAGTQLLVLQRDFDHGGRSSPSWRKIRLRWAQ